MPWYRRSTRIEFRRFEAQSLIGYAMVVLIRYITVGGDFLLGAQVPQMEGCDFTRERVTKNQRGCYTCGIPISPFDYPEMYQVRFLPTGGEMAVSHLELMFPGTQKKSEAFKL